MSSHTLVDKNTLSDAELLEKQFSEDGYVVVKNAIPLSRIAELRSSITSYIESSNQGIYGQPDELIKKVYKNKEPVKGIITDLFVNCPDALDVICNTAVVDALKAILGESFVVLPDSTAHWGYYNILHTDTTTAEQQGWMYHKEEDYRVVVVGMYLQENNANGGGLYLVPGSHRLPDPFVKLRKELPGKQAKLKKSLWKRFLKRISFNTLYNFEAPFLTHPDGIDVRNNLGDVIIFDMRMLHRSSFPAKNSPSPKGGKVSVFVHCSRNNQHADNYVDYIKTKYNAYSHLHNLDRDTSIQDARFSEFDIKGL